VSVPAIPGTDELVGKGVYHGIPNDLPHPTGDGHAVVVGDPLACAAAARALLQDGWSVTAVTPERRCCAGIPRECRLRTGTEVVCASGTTNLEALVMRRIRTGRIEAINASALFIVSAAAGTRCRRPIHDGKALHS
jgi:hypothetical protein